MAKEQVLKSGQITLPRILFLLVVGGAITATVALGGVWLSIGYWAISLGLCVLLYLIAIDYGITLDTSDYKTLPASEVVEGGEASEVVRTTMTDSKGRRRPARVTKRRR